MYYPNVIQFVLFLFRVADVEHDTDGSVETSAAPSSPKQALAVDTPEGAESHEGI